MPSHSGPITSCKNLLVSYGCFVFGRVPPRSQNHFCCILTPAKGEPSAEALFSWSHHFEDSLVGHLLKRFVNDLSRETNSIESWAAREARGCDLRGNCQRDRLHVLSAFPFGGKHLSGVGIAST